jgi:hypothetical protein
VNVSPAEREFVHILALFPFRVTLRCSMHDRDLWRDGRTFQVFDDDPILTVAERQLLVWRPMATGQD